MTLSYNNYYQANLAICFGLVAFSVIVVNILQCSSKSKLLYALVMQMFGVEYIPSDDEGQSDKINMFGRIFSLKKKSFYRVLSRMTLSSMTGIVIGITIIVFVDGVILNVIYLPINHECPDGGDMDCYSTSDNHSYFFCNSSNSLIPESFGGVTCFKWFKKDISTLLILEYLGICTGLFQIYNWIVQLYLRSMLYLFTAPCRNWCTVLIRINFTLNFTVLPFSGLIFTVGFLFYRETSITGLTMAVLLCAIITMLMAWFLLFILGANVIKTVGQELASNKARIHSSDRSGKPREQEVELCERKPTASV